MNSQHAPHVGKVWNQKMKGLYLLQLLAVTSAFYSFIVNIIFASCTCYTSHSPLIYKCKMFSNYQTASNCLHGCFAYFPFEWLPKETYCSLAELLVHLHKSYCSLAERYCIYSNAHSVHLQNFLFTEINLLFNCQILSSIPLT